MKKILLLLSFIACVSQSNAQWWSTEASTVAAGNGQGAEPNQINHPQVICVTSDNAVYIADTPNYRIQKWEEGATEGVTVAGDGINSQEPTSVGFPTGLYVEELESGNVMYIVDGLGHKVIRWVEGEDQGVTVAGGAGSGSELNQISFAAGIFKKGNDLYICDSNNARVLRWTIGESEGVVVAGGNGAGVESNQLSLTAFNGSLYIDEDENVYVTEYIGHRVSKWSTGATEGTVVAEGTDDIILINPSGLAISQDGLVLVSDYSNDSYSISAWDDGEFVGYIQEPGSIGIIQPTGLALNSENDLYVCEYDQNAIRKFEYLIPQITISGNGTEIDNGSTSGSDLDDTNFGEVIFGESLTRSFTIENVGEFDLEVTDISLAGPSDFTIDSPTAFTVAVGESETFDITYEPSDYDLNESDVVTVLSNDATNGAFTFTVEATSGPNTTGVNEITASSPVRVFPNPVSSGTFEIRSDVNMSLVTLYDIVGKKTLQVKNVSTGKTIDVQAIPSGIYIIIVELNDGQLFSTKLMKN